mmetsp:Transcript_10741/g.25283  ORF Transcript_10741/g.25283 Transcript_10741/m.25283 type:complete len:293 (+) Transcript_10741:2620-3498(+)
MDGHDGVVVAELDARSDDAVHLVLVLGVAALHRVEVERGLAIVGALALRLAARRAAAHADAVGGAAHLAHPQPRLREALGRIGRAHLPQACREHDRLEPLAPLPVGQAHAEGPVEATDDGLAELVAVVGGPVARLDLDAARVREVGRVGRLLLPRQRVALEVQVAHAVGGDTGHREGATPRRLHVTQAAAGARLSAGEGGDAAGEVVRLGRQDVVVRVLDEREGRRAHCRAGPQCAHGAALDRGRVVVECDDRVVGDEGTLEGLLDDLEERAWHLHAVEHHPPAEEPVARVL